LKNIWVPLSGAIAQQRKVEVLANNVANANTPGFKRDQIAFREHLTALERNTPDINLPHKDWAPEDFYHTQGAENAFVKVDGTYTDHGQGQLHPTKNPLDLALQGPGFFEVLTPNGIRFTRRGSFTITSNGTLTTSQGYPILKKVNRSALGEESNPADPAKGALPPPTERVFNLSGRNIIISLQGEIIVDGASQGDLSVVEFNDNSALKKEGSSLFINPDKQNFSTTAAQSSVYQGFLEQSNVNAIIEMSELIKANRHFESIQRAIKTYDQISGKSVNDIAKF
jgi:flagellar basal-body rod protein FlgF